VVGENSAGLYYGYTCVEERTVITKVQKWGNSQGIRLSKEMLADADIEVGDAVRVSVEDGVVVVTPLRRVRGRLHLAELVREIPADYEPEEFNWGRPAGREVW
jgi:antitoxin MazE